MLIRGGSSDVVLLLSPPDVLAVPRAPRRCYCRALRRARGDFGATVELARGRMSRRAYVDSGEYFVSASKGLGC